MSLRGITEGTLFACCSMTSPGGWGLVLRRRTTVDVLAVRSGPRARIAARRCARHAGWRCAGSAGRRQARVSAAPVDERRAEVGAHRERAAEKDVMVATGVDFHDLAFHRDQGVFDDGGAGDVAGVPS